MNKHSWIDELPAAITVCAADGTLLHMNDKAAETFARDGGRALLGTNVLDCHPEPSRSMLAAMLENQQPHSYTIEKNGRRKLIHQTPWFEHGAYRGFVEFSFEIPAELSHFVRA